MKIFISKKDKDCLVSNYLIKYLSKKSGFTFVHSNTPINNE